MRILAETHLLTVADTEETFQRKLAHDSESIQVLYCGGEIVGMVILVYDPWASFVWHVAVKPICQGHGFGKMLVSRAEEIVRSRGGKLACAYVLDHNRASRKMFAKMGYSEYPMPIIPIEKNL
jgi:ribosomal protein S18 acetylase RimI-like enzyme